MRTWILVSILMVGFAANGDENDGPTRKRKGPDPVRALSGSSATHESLIGAAAREYVKQKLAADKELRDAFHKSAERLEARGYRKTEEVFVQRSRSTNGPSASGVTTMEDRFVAEGDGEVIFYSWDDGDDTTWEGEIYSKDYVSGAAGLNHGQFLIEGEGSGDLGGPRLGVGGRHSRQGPCCLVHSTTLPLP